MTPSELDVARLAAAGFTNASIARARRTSPRTVANQMRRVLCELRLASRRALALRAELAAEIPARVDVDWSALTPRETEVLTRATRGAQLKVVAIELGLSPSAVSEALRAARTRLGFASLAAMLRARAAAGGDAPR